ncbi:MAG: AAA family ATPase [Chloroflexi bacterium]|nr:AAA family ATPase [Chloroflexota bacterium]
MVMLAGEPGIGKSRLAKEFTVYASLRGAQILSGRCFESEASIPYHPFIQAIQQYVRARLEDELRQELGTDAPEIARMVSEVRQRIPDIPEVPPQEGEPDRLRMFDSVCNFICNAARANPVVLLLDDLQWADESSLAMLRHVARGIAAGRVIILGCYRDVELEENHPLVEAIAELRREPLYQRIVIKGLPLDDVQALLSTLGEQDVPAEFVQEIHGATEGNPLFIEEILRSLVEEGQLVLEEGQWVSRTSGLPEWDIPEGIRDVVKRRISRLSDECLSMLTPASAMPAGFTFDVLKEVTGEDEDRLLDLLDEALRAQVIRERKGTGSRGTGIYELAHTALRHTIYGELSAPRAVRLHRRIGEAIERVYESSVEPHLADLPYHFFRAASAEDVDKAVEYGHRAGERATALLAHEEAARSYRLALRAVDLQSDRDDDERCRLLLALGEAETKAGQGDQAVVVIEQALPLVERLDDDLVTRAALAHEEAVRRSQHAYSGRSIPILRQALERLGEDDSTARTRLLGALAGLPPVGITAEEQIAIGREALAIAERVQDARGVRASYQALLAALSGPEHLDERLTMAQELIRLGSEAGDRYAELWGHIRLMIAFLASGDVDGVDRELEIIYPRAAETREPAYIGRRPSWEGMRAAMQGEWDKADRHLEELLAAFQQVQVAWLFQAATVLMYEIRRAQGRLDELEGPIRAGLEQNPIPAWKGALTLLYCDTGRDADARELLDSFSEDDLQQIPRDWTFVIAICILIWVARQLADKDRARVLYELLLPYRNQHVVVGDAVLYFGSAVYNLGLAAATMGDLDEAETLFKEAIEAEGRCRARPYLARSQYEYATVLVERGDPVDQEKALELVNDALAGFQKMEMPKDVDRVIALKLRLLGIDTSDTRTSIEAVAATVYVEQPDLRPHAAPDGTVTLLFSDIEGSTPMNERLGDQRWMELLREHNVLIREQLRSHQGFEVKTEGDGFMVAFQSARQALQCAVAMQGAFAQRNESAEEPVNIRIGLHTGEPVKEADDFYGKDVNLAARIAGQASGGEILVSSLLYELTDSAGDIDFGEPRDMEMNGLSGTQRVFPVNS